MMRSRGVPARLLDVVDARSAVARRRLSLRPAAAAVRKIFVVASALLGP